jgi:hypothetical protein
MLSLPSWEFVLQGLPIRGARVTSEEGSETVITKAARTANTLLTGRLTKGPAGAKLQKSHELLQQVVNVCRRK